MKSSPLILLFVLFSFLELNAQDPGEESMDPNSFLHTASIPPSPEVASLGMYGEYEVNLSNGLPGISVDLYTIKTRDLTLPITISYHASGIKVNQEASSVGLGWSLNAGGVISRSVNGKPDEDLFGYNNNIDELDDIINGNQVADPHVFNLRTRAANGEIDLQPDVYHFNVNGLAGKFYYIDDTVILINNNIDVEIVNINEQYWQITGPDGTRYVFGLDADHRGRLISVGGCTNGTDNSVQSGSEYFISQIISVNNDTILFEYDPEEVIIDKNYSVSETKVSYYDTPGPVIPPMEKPVYISTTCIASVKHFTRRLKKIIFKNGYVDFVPSYNRLDLNSENAFSIDRIRVYGKDGEFIKSFKFGYSYFGNTSSTQNCRLRLDSLYEVSGTPRAKPAYRFTYNDQIQIPSKKSNAIDFWGYFNGASSAQSLIPSALPNREFYNEGNRQPSANHIGFALLKSIQYPTGGYTEFDFGPNLIDIERDEILQMPPVDLHAESSIADDFVEETQDFEINHAQNINVHFNINLGVIGAGSVAFCKIVKANGTLVWQGIGSGTNTIHLMPGTYTAIVLAMTGMNDDVVSADIYFSYFSETGNTYTEAVPGGGMRINKIVSYDNYGDVLTKEYLYMDENGDNSAVYATKSNPLTSPDTYHYETKITFGNLEFIQNEDDGVGAWICTPVTLLGGWTRKSSNPAILANSGESIVYRNVIIRQTFNSTSNGRTQKKLTIVQDDGGNAFINNVDNSFRRGRPISEKVYNENDVLVKSKSIAYSTVDVSESPFYQKRIGIVVNYFRDFPQVCNNYNPDEIPIYTVFRVFPYNIISNFEPIVSESTADHFGQETVTTQTSYEYTDGAHHNPVKITTTSSEGQTLETTYKYPQDYADCVDCTDANARSIQKMKEAHVFNKPVETLTMKDGLVIAGKLDLFSYAQSDDHISIRPQKSYSLKLNTPKSIEPSRIQNNKLVFSLDYREPDIIVDAYDSHNNITQYHEKDNYQVTILWGYNYSVPIAKIENASFQQVDQALDVSYTELQGITNESNLLLILSELRSDPLMKEAMVYTYTYDPLKGMTTQTGPDGKTTRYSYDDFNRLETIKDHQHNILKHIEYQLQAQ